MRILIKFKQYSVILLIFLNIIMGFAFFSTKNYEIPKEGKQSESIETLPTDLIKSAQSNPQNQVSGTIENREGKIFTNITNNNQFAYINRYNPGLDIQPTLFLQNWNITYARMFFENITAINYTKNIETQPTEYIISFSETDPIYVYQKFAVETDQFINNISIFIQDVIDQDLYTDENSWEVSIVNCSNDPLGTPNSFDTLGTLMKPHPNDMVAHWEVFDFKNSETGAIYLNTSKTNWTTVNTIVKYWFAFKIKIPPDDWRTGGGPKFLYLNPDGNNPIDIGEGETFAQSPQFINLTYNTDDVFATYVVNGTKLTGDLNSFKNFDDDRFIVESVLDSKAFPNRQKVLYFVEFEVDNLTNTAYSWDDLKNLPNDNKFEWKNILNSIVFSLNFSIAANVSSNYNNSKSIALWWYRTYPLPRWEPIFPNLINLTHQNEFIQSFTAIDPEEKMEIIRHMNTSVDGNNSILFLIQYADFNVTNVFNTSINLFNFEVGEIETVEEIQKYDPAVHDLHYANNVSLLNSTFNTPSEEIIDSVKENDNKILEIIGDSNSNTTVVEFNFNILESLNSSMWDVDDAIEWIFNLPNPRIFQIDFRISSNVSIQDEINLTHAVLEIYNGGDFAPFTGMEWVQFSDNKTFADISENTKIIPFDSYYSWFVMHLLNESANHSLRVRLRFVGNGTFERINVSIDEFTLNFHIQNAFSSDVASKIGFGLNSNSLKPSDIQLENFGTTISDTGLWEMSIINGEPSQGFYNFNVTSIWPEVKFDVQGIYTIENFQNIDWEYILDFNLTEILWNVTANLLYYSFYENIQNSQGIQFNVPIDWTLIEVFNYSTSPPTTNGGWYWTIQSNGPFNIIKIFNISDGIWNIGMNSSKTSLFFSSNSTTNTFIDKTINIGLEIQDKYGGDIYFEVYNTDNVRIYSESTNLNETIYENSTSYLWDIFSTSKIPGTYYLKGYWIFYNNTHAFLGLNTTVINVSKYPVNLEILEIEGFSKQYIYGKKILIEGKLINNETGLPIEGEQINVEIYDSTQALIEIKSDITNEEGLIQVEYTLPSGYNGISIKLTYSASETFYSQGESTQPLEISLISQSEYNINIFLSFLPYIGAAVGIIVGTFAVVKYRKSKQRRVWEEEALILDDLIKTSYVMIIHKDVGVSIYDKQISHEKIDADLISGFLQAISAFRTEIKKTSGENLEKKGFEMDYYDFKIVITDGHYIRTALILEGTPSDKLKENQWIFTEHFEKRYEAALEDFTGDVTTFRSADDLVEKHFNVTLIYPLQLGKHYGVVKLKGLEKVLTEVAEQIQKERKFFFISSLLNFGLAGRKASRDEIVSTILTLKEKGLIIPAEME
ncbi:MAG: hypothetical protein ACXABO_10030 [Promethearchaeota archaeon]